MPFDFGGSDKDGDDWPHDDLPAGFNLDEEFKDVEGYVEEYD